MAKTQVVPPIHPQKTEAERAASLVRNTNDPVLVQKKLKDRRKLIYAGSHRPTKPAELNEVPKTDCKVISYAHQSDPNGTRFRAMKADKPPVWAVNFKDEPDYPTNAWGKAYHPTDSYVHWQDRDPEAKMAKLRGLYDMIVAAGVKPKELEELLSVAHDAGYSDGCDSCNPDL